MTVSVEIEGPVAVVTMASENGLNVADLDLMTGLRDELAQLAATSASVSSSSPARASARSAPGPTSST